MGKLFNRGVQYMFEYKNKKHKILKRILIILLLILFVYFIVNYYGINELNKIDNISAAESEIMSNEEQINDINLISNVANCVVGISKLKNTGDTIFLEDGINQMGLGSRNYSFRKWLYFNK